MPRLWSVAILLALLLLCGGVALRADAASPSAISAPAWPAGGPGCWTLIDTSQWPQGAAAPDTYSQELHGVAALAPDNVWVVGWQHTNGTSPLVMHWDGQQWAASGPPYASARLYAVGGVAANDVWAVGSQIAHWNGTQWSWVAHPGTGWLYSLAPIAANDVWAVGDDIEHWDGTAWTVVAHPGGGKQGVAAAGPQDVWAVGGDVEHWDGTAWTVVSAPLANATLSGVAVVAPDDVWAVGAATGPNDPTFTMHWDGSAWTVIPSPSPGTNNVLKSVVALSANDVWAVGEDYNINEPRTLTEHWDGSAWSVVASPNGEVFDNHLYAIAAAGPNDLWTAGVYTIGYYGVPWSLVEHYVTPCPPPPPCTIGWYVIPFPNYQLESQTLRAVAGASGSDVWAVGEHVASSVHHTLIERWDGQQWAFGTSPDVGNLNAVVVHRANDIWAAGTQILHWDGAAWSVVPSPTGTVYSLVALAANDAWAVGQGPGGPLTAHWDGAAWTAVPNPGGANIILHGVSGVAGNDVWAVGEDPAATAQAWHWDGAVWAVVPIPTPNPVQLHGVTALAANDVWAVGYRPYTSQGGAYIMHWDGAAWSTFPTDYYASGVGQLASMSAVTPNDVWAVGTDAAYHQEIALHWDGTRWTSVSLPNPGRYNYAFGVAAFGPLDVWVVGPLTVHYSDPCGGATATPTAMLTATPSLTITRTATASPSLTSPMTSPTSSATRTPPATSTASASPTSPIASPTFTATRAPSATGTATIPAFASPTSPPASPTSGGPTSTPPAPGTPTPSPAPPPTLCALVFSDVPPNSPFYPYIRCLACRGILSGYSSSPPCALGGAPCFQPAAPVTRGQTAKLISNAAGFSGAIPSTQQTFRDVPPSNPFWVYIERAVLHTVISGYSTSPPCLAGQVPCFLPAAPVTRGQVAKMTAQAAGLSSPVPSTQQTFEDIAPLNPFWVYIERLAPLGVISGYTCGQAPAGGCVPPGSRPYFLPGNAVTRGQAAKIVANTFYPSCQTPARR